ncbi:hypothetical protein [Rhizobium sp. BG4]|nr:hypothetical protein [Rhizobium sp. BG4]
MEASARLMMLPACEFDSAKPDMELIGKAKDLTWSPQRDIHLAERP